MITDAFATELHITAPTTIICIHEYVDMIGHGIIKRLRLWDRSQPHPIPDPAMGRDY
jgi:hypothetical protein